MVREVCAQSFPSPLFKPAVVYVLLTWAVNKSTSSRMFCINVHHRISAAMVQNYARSRGRPSTMFRASSVLFFSCSAHLHLQKHQMAVAGETGRLAAVPLLRPPKAKVNDSSARGLAYGSPSQIARFRWLVVISCAFRCPLLRSTLPVIVSARSQTFPSPLWL